MSTGHKLNLQLLFSWIILGELDQGLATYSHGLDQAHQVILTRPDLSRNLMVGDVSNNSVARRIGGGGNGSSG